MSMFNKILSSSLLVALLALVTSALYADVSRVEITDRQTIESDDTSLTYEAVSGVLHLTLDPTDPGNSEITDIAYASVNSDGLVAYTADFKMLIPPAAVSNGTLLYMVNNRGRGRVPPEISLDHPLSPMGFTYLLTGWINELSPDNGRLRLHAPVVGSEQRPITGDVRYEVSVGSASNSENIAGGGHLAYLPTENGLRNASLTQRLYQDDPRIPIERSQFYLDVQAEQDSNQPIVTLKMQDDFRPGFIYELIYEAKDPVLAGAGMSAIRDLVSLIRYEGNSSQLDELDLPAIENTVAWGNSQSGRLLRMFLYDGFNADLTGRQVFDGVIPVIAGSGYGMFNNRFAMPTRTNGQHSNQLFPNDLFPFTYGESTDPFTGRTGGVLSKARATNTVPKLMHIQTSNEYWVRAGSLPHTNPQGTEDAVLPDEVRFYTIGGSQHGSGSGIPQPATSTQLPRNPNMWSPFTDSLIVAMHNWVANDQEPPASRYPKISDGSLVPSHNANGSINRDAWNALNGINHPASLYTVGYANWGDRFLDQRIVDIHPTSTDNYYGALVPAVNTDNNNFGTSTLLPPLTAVPLATFTAWNLRAPATGAEKSLARLAGGYIPFPANTAFAVQSRDPRNSIAALYSSFEDYLIKYEVATDKLIAEGYLLPGFKEQIMNIARNNSGIFE